eukprot:TRINITY_DN21016_c0_g1_i1.p1 TRINITY_DN21016_c0_g1~~TRINITY_DN21016_c0_g1_i1.p1  ORF type:complete len:1009 (-),score=225.99 TRINITY_DN21016_c0_g1_i1:94-3120(-)
MSTSEDANARSGGYPGTEPAPPRFAGAHVLQAIRELYAPGAGSATRNAADKFLRDFERSDAAVPTALKLLAAAAASENGIGVGPDALPPEAVVLLASTVRRRLQRGGAVPGALPPEETLRLASIFSGRAGGAVSSAAELLVHAGVAQWLHAGAPPIDELLREASTGDGTSARMALAALEAVPEEANAKEVRLEQRRADVLLQLCTASSRVLAALGGFASLPLELRLRAASRWLGVFNGNAKEFANLSASPLLPLAGEALVASTPASEAAEEFLGALVEKAGASSTCPEELVDALLRLLAALRPTDVAARGALVSLVNTAVVSWRHFFMAPDIVRTPAAAWVSLLEALAASAAWGPVAASASLKTWLRLRDSASKAGAYDTYAPVLGRAVAALRDAAMFPANFETQSLEDQENHCAYRRELRDGLRLLVADASTAGAFAEEVRKQVLAQLQFHSGGGGSAWQALEEALHALSAPAKALTALASSGAKAVGDSVLQVFVALADDSGPLVGGGCHRQVLCSFLMCVSVYVPLIAAQGDLTLQGGCGGASPPRLAARLVDLARASLQIIEQPRSGNEAIYPFRTKQDHMGVVCLMKLLAGLPGEPSLDGPAATAALRADVAAHLAASARGSGTLEPHSAVILAQAVAIGAARAHDTARDLLGACLSLVRDDVVAGGSASLALSAAREVVDACGQSQGAAVAEALAAFWQILSESTELDVDAMAALLRAVAEKAPSALLDPLARLIAATFARRPEFRPRLLDVATSVAHRAGKEPQAVALAAELVHGLGSLVWAELDRQGRATGRLQLATDSTVRSCDDVDDTRHDMELVSASERALVEAWARMAHEMGRHAPALLHGEDGGAGFSLAFRAAASIVAAPHKDPPAASLALLGESWKNAPTVRAHVLVVLSRPAFEGSWVLGALVVRIVLKAFLGQMLPNAIGLAVPAARSPCLLADAVTAEAWATCAVGGVGFPLEKSTEEVKARFVRELVAARDDAQRFKQACKRFTGGKKK